MGEDFRSSAPDSSRFIDVGGYKLLNNWLTYSKTTNNIPLLQQILVTLQHLPLTVDHLKQVPQGLPVSQGYPTLKTLWDIRPSGE